MKRNTDFMLRDIAGEVILVPTGAKLISLRFQKIKNTADLS